MQNEMEQFTTHPGLRHPFKPGQVVCLQRGQHGAYREVFTAFFEADYLRLPSILYVFK